jgi:hypothetical protein
MPGRRCPSTTPLRDGRRRTCPRILTRGERYCPEHAREYEAQRGTPTERGYDAKHRRLRAHWQSRIDDGEIVRCATCSIRLRGRAWDLGHEDDRTKHRGPECIPCNRGEGGSRGAAISNGARR